MSTDLPPLADREQLQRIAACEQRIGYVFRDKDLLLSALTHASGASHRLASNERLEFLGDAILGAVVCEMLFQQYPEYLEGDLTKIKSAVVSRQTCAKLSEALGIEEFLILGRGMASHPSVPPSLLSDVFEALIAAIYLDGAGDASRAFIEQHLGPEIELAVSGELFGNYKSQLQQMVQREHGTTPVYQLVDEKGPDHSKYFQIVAEIDGQQFEPAWGRNKKEAEQRAARNALKVIRADGTIHEEDSFDDNGSADDPSSADQGA